MRYYFTNTPFLAKSFFHLHWLKNQYLQYCKSLIHKICTEDAQEYASYKCNKFFPQRQVRLLRKIFAWNSLFLKTGLWILDVLNCRSCKVQRNPTNFCTHDSLLVLYEHANFQLNQFGTSWDIINKIEVGYLWISPRMIQARRKWEPGTDILGYFVQK